jgi:hypothetical protein
LLYFYLDCQCVAQAGLSLPSAGITGVGQPHSVFYFFSQGWEVLEFELRASHLLDRHSTT